MQDEGVLKDVLDELDRERTRRAELELKVYQLELENEGLRESQRVQQERTDTAASAGISYVAFRALQAEVEGYRGIIDTLTLGKPAIAAAAQAENVLKAKQNKTNRHYESPANSIHDRSRHGGPPQGTTSSASPSAVKAVAAVAAATTPLFSPTSVKRTTLPLHVVRLLEVLPWEARARQHMIAVEQIYEWQVFKDQQWQSHMKYFPVLFKSLRLVKAASSSPATDAAERPQHHPRQPSHGGGGNHNPANHAFAQLLSGAELQKRNKQRILTDASITVLYDTDAGFPLPTTGGVWEWIGSWRVVNGAQAEVVTNASSTATRDKNDTASSEVALVCDENGWTYVVNPRDFIAGPQQQGGGEEPPQSKLFGDPGLVSSSSSSSGQEDSDKGSKKQPQRLFRRRKWVRQRNLVDYPFASEFTRQYLRLQAEYARQHILTAKINDQLIQTKATLTEAEERLIKAKNCDNVEYPSLPSDQVVENNEDTKKLEEELIGGETNNHVSFSSPLRSPTVLFELNPMDKISEWVHQQQSKATNTARKTSEDITLSDDSGTEDGLGTDSTHTTDSTGNNNAPVNFDWKKNLGRGAQLMQKLKTVRTSGGGGGGGGLGTTIAGTTITASSLRRAFRPQQQQPHGAPTNVLESREEEDLML